MDLHNVTVVFGASGFEHRANQYEHLWSIYLRPISAEWLIQARADWRDQSVDVGLKPPNDLGRSTVGTVHRFRSEPAMARDLGSAVAHLEGLARQPDCLKCATCRARWVHLKEGGRHRPFLSCDGMVIAGKKPNRGPLCRGTSEVIPALVEHG